LRRGGLIVSARRKAWAGLPGFAVGGPGFWLALGREKQARVFSRTRHRESVAECHVARAVLKGEWAWQSGTSASLAICGWNRVTLAGTWCDSHSHRLAWRRRICAGLRDERTVDLHAGCPDRRITLVWTWDAVTISNPWGTRADTDATQALLTDRVSRLKCRLMLRKARTSETHGCPTEIRSQRCHQPAERRLKLDRRRTGCDPRRSRE
jgi:hypothetical protein